MKIIKAIIALSIFYPILFQLLFGLLSIAKKTMMKFRKIVTISLIMQLLFSILVVYTSYRSLDQPVKCLNPMLPILGVILTGFLLLIIIILFQLLIKWLINKGRK